VLFNKVSPVPELVNVIDDAGLEFVNVISVAVADNPIPEPFIMPLVLKSEPVPVLITLEPVPTPAILY
jgi:hypothetical protein